MAASSPCCICVGGVNYTVSCKCNPCGGACALAMSTSAPNPSVNQNVGGSAKGDGGASFLSCTLNSIGKWGSVLTAQASGRTVTTGCGLRVGAGLSTIQAQANNNLFVMVIIVAAILLFLTMNKG